MSTSVYLASGRMRQLADEAGQDVYFVGGDFGDHRMYESLADGVLAELARDRPALAEAVAGWALDAGYAVPVPDIVRQLKRRKEPYVQHLFFELLGLIGLGAPARVPEQP